MRILSTSIGLVMLVTSSEARKVTRVDVCQQDFVD